VQEPFKHDPPPVTVVDTLTAELAAVRLSEAAARAEALEAAEQARAVGGAAAEAAAVAEREASVLRLKLEV